jgi:lipopolysaccharide export LptBFGC system permease protein LptF
MTGTDLNNNDSSSTAEHKIKELEQEKIFLEEMNAELDQKADELASKNIDLEKKLSAENEVNKKKIESAMVTAENAVESAMVTAENLVESAMVTAENVKKQDLVKAENMINSALSESENLIVKAVDEVENIVESTVDEVENIIQNAIHEFNILKDLKVIEINNITKSARIEVEHLKKTARIASENMKKTARTASENMKRIIEIDFENLRKSAEISAENLKKIALVESENLEKIKGIEFKNPKKTAMVIADNLLESARVTAENLRKDAMVTDENLLESARVTAENLRKDAKFTAESLVSSAKNYSSQSLKNTYEMLEKNKKIKDRKNLQLNKKYLIPLAMVCILLIGISVLYPNPQPKRIGLGSEYLIENVKGEKIITWTAWNLVEGDPFHIQVLASPEVTPERLKVIEDDVLSNETVTVGDLKYYKGWAGAFAAMSPLNHTLVIPSHFDVTESNTGSGNIVIKLSSLENADGYMGYTKSIADGTQHQILKSDITIYNVDKISNDELAIILRHELAHGFGLGHADDENDLMFPNVQAYAPYGYISECDVEAMTGLYDGNERSQVICTK